MIPQKLKLFLLIKKCFFFLPILSNDRSTAANRNTCECVQGERSCCDPDTHTQPERYALSNTDRRIRIANVLKLT